jgi:predicted nuclease of predicted toxin-antitoxin system
MSPPAVKLDENLGRSHVQLLQAAGYQADRVTDEGLSGAADRAVWERVQAEKRFFITLDLDFSDVRQFPPGSHAGLLLLRPRSKSRDAVTEILQSVLREHPLGTLSGCFAVADPGQTRIRRPIGPAVADADSAGDVT